MSKTLIFTFIIFTTVILLVTGCSNEEDANRSSFCRPEVKLNFNGREISFPLNYRVREQETTKRKWRTIELKEEFAIGGLEDSVLFQPMDVKSDAAGNIFIADVGDKSIKKYDSKGKFLKKIGREGKGPGEFDRPFAIDVTDDGNLLVEDQSLKRCIFFKDGKPLHIKLNYNPSRIALLSDNKFVVFQTYAINEYPHLESYNIEGEKITSYKKLIDIKDKRKLFGVTPAFRGTVFSLSGSEVVYVPLVMNHILCFNPGGSLKYGVETIDDIDDPLVEMTSTGAAVRIKINTDDDKIASKGAGLFNGNILNVSLHADVKERVKVFDIYSADNGEYLYSYKTDDLPEMRDIYFDDKRIFYIKHDGSVSVMKVVQKG